jgi:hypothetical protein
MASLKKPTPQGLIQGASLKKPTPQGLVRAGELGLFKELLPPAQPVLTTRAQQALLDAGQIIQEAPDDAELAFLARQLVQCTLPHANPGEVPRWLRRNGHLSLTIQPGWDTKKDASIGYPYGTIPRLLLFWLNKEAVQTKSRRIELGRSLASFMRQLGLDPSRGGKRSDSHRMKDQMQRLFRARISFDSSVEVAGGEMDRWLDMPVAPKGQLWWDHKQPLQDDLFESWIELGEEFYNAIVASPVPVDMRALKALKRSPLALDLYAWATHKALSVSRKGRPQFIPWASLAQQFGSDYVDHLEFKRKAKVALKKIQIVYPDLKLSNATGGLLVLPASRPAIALKPKNFYE